MPVSLVSVEIHLPEARSLKDKRRIVKSLSDRITSRYRASIAETGKHDLRQLSEIGIALVGPAQGHLESLVDSIRAIFDARPDVVVASWRQQVRELEE